MVNKAAARRKRC